LILINPGISPDDNGHPGYHRELTSGDGAGDVLEVVGVGTYDFDVLLSYILGLIRCSSSNLNDNKILKNKGLLVNSYPRGGITAIILEAILTR